MVTRSTLGEAMSNGANPTSSQTVVPFVTVCELILRYAVPTELLGEVSAAEGISPTCFCSSVG